MVAVRDALASNWSSQEPRRGELMISFEGVLCARGPAQATAPKVAAERRNARREKASIPFFSTYSYHPNALARAYAQARMLPEPNTIVVNKGQPTSHPALAFHDTASEVPHPAGVRETKPHR